MATVMAHDYFAWISMAILWLANGYLAWQMYRLDANALATMAKQRAEIDAAYLKIAALESKVRDLATQISRISEDRKGLAAPSKATSYLRFINEVRRPAEEAPIVPKA